MRVAISIRHDNFFKLLHQCKVFTYKICEIRNDCLWYSVASTKAKHNRLSYQFLGKLNFSVHCLNWYSWFLWKVGRMEEAKSPDDHMTSAAAFVEGGIQDACDDACSICLEEFSESDPLTVISISFLFYFNCTFSPVTTLRHRDLQHYFHFFLVYGPQFNCFSFLDFRWLIASMNFTSSAFLNGITHKF